MTAALADWMNTLGVCISRERHDHFTDVDADAAEAALINLDERLGKLQDRCKLCMYDQMAERIKASQESVHSLLESTEAVPIPLLVSLGDRAIQNGRLNEVSSHGQLFHFVPCCITVNGPTVLKLSSHLC